MLTPKQLNAVIVTICYFSRNTIKEWSPWVVSQLRAHWSPLGLETDSGWEHHYDVTIHASLIACGNGELTLMTERQALNADKPLMIRIYRRSEKGFSTARATELCFEKKKKEKSARDRGNRARHLGLFMKVA